MRRQNGGEQNISWFRLYFWSSISSPSTRERAEEMKSNIKSLLRKTKQKKQEKLIFHECRRLCVCLCVCVLVCVVWFKVFLPVAGKAVKFLLCCNEERAFALCVEQKGDSTSIMFVGGDAGKPVNFCSKCGRKIN